MRLKDRKILITGGGGFIGSHLADALAAENEVTIVDDFSVGLRENVAHLRERPNVTVVEADICDGERMTATMDGVEVVFHMAISCLRTSLNHPELSHRINAGGTLSTCAAARQAGVKRFVYCSSSEIYGSAVEAPMSEGHPLNPTTVYGASKLAGEHYAMAYLRTYGLPVTVVRPFNTYGPREPAAGPRAEVIPRFLMLLSSGRRPVIYGDGSQTRDFTYVEDTVAGLVLAGECDELVGDVVNVARGREVSIGRIAELCMKLTGTESVGVEHAAARPGDVARHYADVSKAGRLLGFEARVDIEEGLARTREWLAERPTSPEELEGAGRPNW